MLPTECLIIDGTHRGGLGGRQLIYRFKDGHGLSVVNSPLLHNYPFAWEIAVLENVSEDGNKFSLTYDTSLTTDVEVFQTETAAAAFIRKAIALFQEKSNA